MHNIIRQITYTFLFSCIAISTTNAASIDCKISSKSLESGLICSDGNISDLDTKLAEIYHDQLSAADPELQVRMRESQRSWLDRIHVGLHAMQNHALKEKKAEKSTRDILLHWLRNEYSSRIHVLNDSTIIEKGITFYKLTMYQTFPSETDTSYDDGRPIQEGIYTVLQIVSPRSIADKKFNLSNLEPHHFFGPCSEINNDVCDNDYERLLDINKKILVDDYLIQIPIYSTDYPHGAAHGTPEMTTIIWLRQKARNLQVSDIFDEHKIMKDGLHKLVKGLLVSGCNIDYLNVKHWSILKEGVLIQAQPYDCGSYAGGEDIILSWKDLKPFLVANPPFTIVP